MVYVAAAVGFVAFLALTGVVAWQIARRQLERRAAAEQSAKSVQTQMIEFRAELAVLAKQNAALAERIGTQEKALVNSLQEMRALLAPVRKAVLHAVPDGVPRQSKEG